MQHTCLLCKKEFIAEDHRRRYCSMLCFRSRNKHLKNRECLSCGAIFIAYPNWIKRGGGKYCSRKCHAVAMDKKIDKFCLHCGVGFRIKKSTARHNASKYCSPKCSQNASIGTKKPTISGPLSPNWNGGSSFAPYPFYFNDGLKEKIRARDNYVCRVCGMQEEEHILVYSASLHVHHIDYVKQNCGMNNLVPLCVQCHGRTNYNREYWQKYFHSQMEELIK